MHDEIADAFDDLAADYDGDGRHTRIAHALVDLLKPDVLPVLVIDAAAGSGAAAFAAVSAWGPRRVLAVDASAQMLAAGVRAAPTLDPHRRVEWVHGPAVPLPVAEGEADVVLCASSLHFLGTEAFPDWSRVLRPGGAVGFTLPTAASFQPSPAFRRLLPTHAVPLPHGVEDAVALAGDAGFINARAVLLDVGAPERPQHVAVVAATRP